MKNDQLFSEIQSHMRRFEDVWYKRTEEGMEVYIADIKEFFVDNGGYVEQYKNVMAMSIIMRLTTACFLLMHL